MCTIFRLARHLTRSITNCCCKNSKPSASRENYLGCSSLTSLTGSNTSRLAVATEVRGGLPVEYRKQSILGPLLFLSYCLDLTHGTKSSVFSFADDTKLLSRTPAGNESSLPDYATTLFVWSEKNALPLNTGKRKLLGFQKPHLPRITLGDQELSLASSI